MNKKLWFLLVLLLSLVLALGACSSSSGDGDDKGKDDGKTEDTNKGDDGESADSGEPQDGGTLVYALDSPPHGVFQTSFYSISTDAEVLDFVEDGLVDYDDELKPVPGLAEWETEDNQHYTFKFKEGVKWHNGEELTVDDWIFTLETLADGEYTGSRYMNVKDIEGAADYHDGKADSISGLKKINDYEIEVTFDKARVNNLENVWTNLMPKKEFEGIPVAEMEEHELVRKNPVGTGPYKITKVVDGESIQLEAFDDYWQGKPHIDKIIVKVIDPSLTVGELKNGSVDLVAFHPSVREDIEALDNVEMLTAPGLSYYYIGFRLGSWDGKKNVADYDKYDNKQLRQAMAHAINREEWVEEFFNGLGTVINRPVPSAHWIAADDSELEHQYEFDPEKAKELLDEAGYVDVNDDGFREDPDGNEFVVKFGHYATGNPTFETRAKAITQYWEDVGLKTELDMKDSELYYDQLEEGDESVETFFGGWGTSADPDPSGLWKTEDLWNYPRWVNEKNDQLLEDAIDFEVVGTDQDKRKELYIEWQKLVNEEVPMIIVAELTDNYAVSNRVNGLTIDVSGRNSAHEWWVTQD